MHICHGDGAVLNPYIRDFGIGDDDDGRIAAEELRSLIEEVVLLPGEKRGEVHAKLRGELFGILDFVEAEHRHRPGEVRTKVEACPRNH